MVARVEVKWNCEFLAASGESFACKRVTGKEWWEFQVSSKKTRLSKARYVHDMNILNCTNYVLLYTNEVIVSQEKAFVEIIRARKGIGHLLDMYKFPVTRLQQFLEALKWRIISLCYADDKFNNVPTVSDWKWTRFCRLPNGDHPVRIGPHVLQIRG